MSTCDDRTCAIQCVPVSWQRCNAVVIYVHPSGVSQALVWCTVSYFLLTVIRNWGENVECSRKSEVPHLRISPCSAVRMCKSRRFSWI